MSGRTKWFPVLLAAVLVISAACGSDDDNGDEAGAGGETASEEGNGSEESGGNSGRIEVDGSSTVGPLAEVAAEMFMAENPDVQVTVRMSGTSGGFEKFCIGETDMNNGSREIKDTEIDLCADNDIGYDNVQVANDALSLVVNNDNPVDCLTVEQANQIWDLDSDVSTWGDIDDLDIPEDAADQSIELYGPGTDSGTFDFFTEVINGEEGRIRTDYIDIGEDDHAAVVAVQGDEYAMGYIPYSYIQEAGDDIKALEIDGGDGCVAATLDNVQDGSYSPLGRPLFTYASDVALSRPETVDFMNFWVDNSAEIAETATFVPMTEEQMDESRSKIEQLAG